MQLNGVTSSPGAVPKALNEATRLLADGFPIDAGDPAPLGDALVLKHDTANDLVIMLDGIGEAPGEVLEAL